MKFLCLDTTLNNCSIHIVSPGKECLTVSDNQVPPSDVIPILVKKAMLKLNLKISDIDGIIVATGPGNFTSLRVGISFGVGLWCSSFNCNSSLSSFYPDNKGNSSNSH